MNSAADPTAAFAQSLQSSGLLTPAQLREVSGWIAHQKPDLKGLATELNRRGWLTPFQIREIARGRGSGLRVADRYALLDILGEGGMGRVYKAHDTRMGRDVAFKVIRKEKLSHPVVVDRFEQEIQALSRMSKHPNVVEVFIADQVGDHHYCVMEFIDGSDLTKIVRAGGPLPVPRACDIIRQAALGLEHAFQTGLVHRDIKPSNIIVPNNGGPVKLVDLGLARVLDAAADEDAHRITQEGFVIGTPDFLAPEQARNPMSVDIRADVYALGGTLFYLLTGRVPYDGGSPTEKLLKHCTEPPPDLLDHRPDAPPAVQQIIHWCMAKRAEDRPQTPMQLAVALQSFCPPQAGPGPFVLPTSGLHAAPPARVAAAAYPVPVPAGAPPHGAPPPGYPYPAYPHPPVYAQPVIPVPPLDPNASSQVFKLPPRNTDEDPIRKRSAGRFPTGLALVAGGALFVVAVLAFATYRLFLHAAPAVPEPFTNTQGMKMVRVDGGTFRMGSPETEPGRRPDEGPVREVTIRGPFFVSATEVTNGPFLKVMGRNESHSAQIAARSDLIPADSVTWDEANEFCRKLTEREKGQPWSRKDWEYRLPTEAEWEYACRAGSDAPFTFGAGVKFGDQAVFRPSDDDPLGIGGDPNKPPRFAQEAGKAEANRFGLHDTHGNLAEWCSDWYRSEAYKDGTRDNPTGPSDGDKRVIRGGSFRDLAAATRSAARAGARPTQRLDTVGFRVVYAPIVK
jgi:formylglycine-generating enzyme required for sulfatase activity/tRNA A-37 threonylcarbamoyl transferase component Bud32